MGTPWPIFQSATPSEARGLKSLGKCEVDPIDYGVAASLVHEVLRAKYFDSSVTECILSYAEGLLRNDMRRFGVDS